VQREYRAIGMGVGEGGWRGKGGEDGGECRRGGGGV